MSDLLIVQSKGARPDAYDLMLYLTQPVTERYAAACGADYQLFVGFKDPTLAIPPGATSGVRASWNRIPLILEAFAVGYRKVAWLDLDTLVVDLDQSIFDGTDDVTPLHYLRIPRPSNDGWIENDGVIVANNTPGAVDALSFIWDHRHEPNAGYEQGWIDQHAFDHPEFMMPLDPRFNWWDWGGTLGRLDPTYPARHTAVILAWHATERALKKMRVAYDDRWVRNG